MQLSMPTTTDTGTTTGSTSDAGSSSSTTSSVLGSSSVDQLTSESTFLNLLVAQIQNQDPLNPTDSIQFVGQLVSYSQLEQLLGINQGVQTLVTDSGSTSSTTTTSPTSSSSGS